MTLHLEHHGQLGYTIIPSVSATSLASPLTPLTFLPADTIHKSTATATSARSPHAQTSITRSNRPAASSEQASRDFWFPGGVFVLGAHM